MNNFQDRFTEEELNTLLLMIIEQEAVARYKTLDIERFNSLEELYNLLRYGQREQPINVVITHSNVRLSEIDITASEYELLDESVRLIEDEELQRRIAEKIEVEKNN